MRRCPVGAARAASPRRGADAGRVDEHVLARAPWATPRGRRPRGKPRDLRREGRPRNPGYGRSTSSNGAAGPLSSTARTAASRAAQWPFPEKQNHRHQPLTTLNPAASRAASSAGAARRRWVGALPPRGQGRWPSYARSPGTEARPCAGPPIGDQGARGATAVIPRELHQHCASRRAHGGSERAPPRQEARRPAAPVRARPRQQREARVGQRQLKPTLTSTADTPSSGGRGRARPVEGVRGARSEGRGQGHRLRIAEAGLRAVRRCARSRPRRSRPSTPHDASPFGFAALMYRVTARACRAIVRTGEDRGQRRRDGGQAGASVRRAEPRARELGVEIAQGADVRAVVGHVHVVRALFQRRRVRAPSPQGGERPGTHHREGGSADRLAAGGELAHVGGDTRVFGSESARAGASARRPSRPATTTRWPRAARSRLTRAPKAP